MKRLTFVLAVMMLGIMMVPGVLGAFRYNDNYGGELIVFGSVTEDVERARFDLFSYEGFEHQVSFARDIRVRDVGEEGIFDVQNPDDLDDACEITWVRFKYTSDDQEQRTRYLPVDLC